MGCIRLMRPSASAPTTPCVAVPPPSRPQLPRGRCYSTLTGRAIPALWVGGGGLPKGARLVLQRRQSAGADPPIVDRLWPFSLVRGVRPSAHTQRRRKANANVTNPTGATPAIQSQWTKRPNSGLIVALATMATPTTSAAQNSENAHVLEPGGPVVPPPLRPLPVALLAISHLPRLAGRRFQQSQHRHHVRCEFGATGAVRLSGYPPEADTALVVTRDAGESERGVATVDWDSDAGDVV